MRPTPALARFLCGLALGLAFLTLATTSRARADVVDVYSATDRSAVMRLIAAFETLHPSIRVNYTEYQSAELYQAIREGKGTPDVVISSAMDLQTALVNAGYAQPLETPYAGELPQWATWRDELFGFTFEPVVMAYNRKAFAGRKLPRDRSELAGMIRDDPAFFKGRIGTYDVRASGVGYLFATEDARRGYQFPRLTESFGRAKARLFCCTSQMLSELASGRIVFAYNLIGSYAIKAAEKDPDIGVTLFSDYTLVMSRTAFIARNAPHPAAAAAFLNFLLSPEGQKAIASDSGLIPLVDVGPKPRMDGLLSRSNALIPIRLGPGLLAYLDSYKKRRFISDWKASIAAPSDAGP